MLKHASEVPSENRFNMLRNGSLRYNIDGLNSLEYKEKEIRLHKLFTHILVLTWILPTGTGIYSKTWIFNYYARLLFYHYWLSGIFLLLEVHCEDALTDFLVRQVLLLNWVQKKQKCVRFIDLCDFFKHIHRSVHVFMAAKLCRVFFIVRYNYGTKFCKTKC